MNSDHRKVELQSPADLAFLTTQIRSAAAQKLDLHLPPVTNSSEPDELRQKVSELVDTFVAQVVGGMRHNISINGMDVVAEEGSEQVGVGAEVEKEEFEAYDEALRAKLADMSRRRDQLISQISKHRRTTPAAAAERFKQSWEKETETLMRAAEEQERVAGKIGGDDVVAVEALKRQEEVVRNWERAVEGLGVLKGGLPETRARLERAGGVVAYLEGKETSMAS
ncbi:hypothetical protein BDV96DRAFT_612587 [Lophiotrema nucula]|uniref:Kinetochore protein mis14 n=1 Tax=Lophiotrema nucula TaxID=690887 RepID=A0A6A5Z827_9PLEO|nr:hypothetical protein BDV96DRAFT_612587 [Lophiotrema nucula]